MAVGVNVTAGHGLPEQIRSALYARWARLPYAILIQGETGTGKSLLARWLHAHSGRSGRVETCSLAELPDELAFSALFGHVRGAFTGASSDRVGVFEAAGGGTVILEEVGKASLRVQGALLRAVEEKKAVRIGELQERPVEFRLIAVSNQDLDAMVERGTFLEDLRARFGYYVAQLAPLREQRDAILGWAQQFLEAESAALGREAPPALVPEVRELLREAPWRRNLRELRDVCRYLVGNAGDCAGVADLPPAFLRTVGIAHAAEPLHERLGRVLAETGGNKAKAARILRMSRGRLYRLLASSPGSA